MLSSKIRKLDLSVIKSGIINETVQVKVEKLVKKSLKIKCLDENRDEITAIAIDPPTVDIFVREGFSEDAIVILSDRDITAAQKDYAIKTPFVELDTNVIREGKLVKIKLPPFELDT